MRAMKKLLISATLFFSALGTLSAQNDTVRQSVLPEVSIQSKSEGIKRMSGAVNGSEIGQDELFRAACCNLGESFVANPAVDVNYSDAAVGARQIRLLGLGGQYVQMLCEGLPMAGGAAQPYLLGRVPGAWMRSISVSKGTSSVKNGPQSITGQIDVEYLKPDEEPGLLLNLYTDSHLKTEGNLMGNLHLNRHLSSEIFAHYEHEWMHHDMNSDGWIDMPAVEQLQLQNRWKYRRGRYIMHAGVGYLNEHRTGGQLSTATPFAIDILSHGVEAYMKHAYLLDREHNTNLAFMGNVHGQWMDGAFGAKYYTENQQDVYAQLMLEHDFSAAHQLSAGISFSGVHETESLDPPHWAQAGWVVEEYTPGAYAQYTYKPSYRLTAMGGLRVDHSTLYDRTYVTPRLHVKWLPVDWLTLRGSVGKGYRTPRPWAENHYLIASGRTMVVDRNLPQEEAWNSGICASFYIPVGGRTVTLNAEYYYTDFRQQAVVDFDSDPTKILITALEGTSYSHTLQLDATYTFNDEWEAMAAFRMNDVRCTYDGRLLEKPLQSRYKGLLTVSWEPMMALWHVDLTLQLNGPGRMPTPRMLADGTPAWDESFPAYPQINLQITRDFRHMSVYIGGENLTNYRQPVPVIAVDNPWSAEFDPTMLWGPVYGIMAYAGVRMHLWRD